MALRARCSIKMFMAESPRSRGAYAHVHARFNGKESICSDIVFRSRLGGSGLASRPSDCSPQSVTRGGGRRQVEIQWNGRVCYWSNEQSLHGTEATHRDCGEQHCVSRTCRMLRLAHFIVARSLQSATIWKTSEEFIVDPSPSEDSSREPDPLLRSGRLAVAAVNLGFAYHSFRIAHIHFDQFGALQ